MDARSEARAMAVSSMFARPGRTAPIRSIRPWALMPPWTRARWHRAGTGWACACTATMAAWRNGRSSRSRFVEALLL
ncbi:hypothetical protein G6F66_015671 [Rhizopus arrhizus]|nr:hypothetical protein G6F66_015671 [Rhizopus arrhizus]